LVELEAKAISPLGQIFIAFEGVRSIDGTIAPLDDILRACSGFNAFTVLDDSHGFGILGESGRGTAEAYQCVDRIDMRIATCSKAIGCQGGFISSNSQVISFLRRTATPYLFTTAMALTTVAAIDEALNILFSSDTPIPKLHSNRQAMEHCLTRSGIEYLPSATGILPVMPKGKIDHICRELFDAGLFVNVVEFPMIPKKRAPYLRFSLMSTHTIDHVEQAVAVLNGVLNQVI
jgi:glycine C-acetyltransferase